MTRYTMRARSQGALYVQRAAAARPAEEDVHSMDPGVEFTVRSGSIVLYGRSPFAHSICVQPHEDKRKPFTLGLSDPLIEVDAVVHKDIPLDCVCDLGYGIAPGKPTTNTVWTAVEDYTWFETFSEEGCATGIACTPATHMQDKRKER